MRRSTSDAKKSSACSPLLFAIGNSKFRARARLLCRFLAGPPSLRAVAHRRCALDTSRRQAHGERAAAADFAFDFELRLVPKQHVFDDCESESGAARGARATAVDAVETLG